MNSILTEEKFNDIFPLETPRPGQREIIEDIIKAYNNGKKYVILEAPCGIGKSVIGYSIARYFGNAYFLTSQKILQNQYYNDFKLPYVLGRNNYTCLKNTNLTCEFGACFRSAKNFCKDIYKGTAKCPYLIARSNCLNSNYSNLNYSYFLSILNVSHMLNERELIVCDEAHNLETELLKQNTIKITDKLLSFLGIHLSLPDIGTSDSNKCSWLIRDLLEKIKSQYLHLKTQMSQLDGLKSTKEFKKIAGRYSAIEKLVVSISDIKSQLETEKKGSLTQKIVISQTSEYIEFKSLFAINAFQNSLDTFGKRFLFMSATILNPKLFCKNLGINYNNVEFIKCSSNFPVENRLIYYKPIGSLSYKNKNESMPKLINAVDKILKKHKNVKGIIHTVNYDIAEKIIEGLRFSDQSSRLLMPRGNDKQLLLDTFYASKKPYVLISPSLTEGIDLKEDLSRLCIICKVPYANLTDKWTKERMTIDSSWYSTAACINLVQMSGRSIRSETDFANTYILDNDFEKLAINANDIFPEWWKDSVVLE